MDIPLNAPIRTYIRGRRDRGELGPESARDLNHTLASLADTYGNRPIPELGPAHIDTWLASIGDRAPSTRRSYLSRVRCFCRWLQASGKIQRDPTLHVPRIRQPRRVVALFTPEEVRQIFARADDHRDRLMLMLFYAAGLRCCEVAGVEVGDFDPGRRTLFVRRGKGGHERVVHLAAADAEITGGLLRSMNLLPVPMILNRNRPGHGITPATVSHHTRDFLWATGVKQRALDGRSGHTFRRTHGNELMLATANIRVVPRQLGHEKFQTTAGFSVGDVADSAVAEGVDARRRLIGQLEMAA